MNMNIRFPETIGRKILDLPDRDKFVSHAVAEALRRQPPEQADPGPCESRWSRIVRRVEGDSEQLGSYYSKFQADMREFRERFRFRHDGPE